MTDTALEGDAPASPLLSADKIREQSLAWWRDRGLPVDARPIPCGFCGREYLRPCDDDNHARCQNFQFRQDQKSKGSDA